jgi:hypothetical protein
MVVKIEAEEILSAAPRLGAGVGTILKIELDLTDSQMKRLIYEIMEIQGETWLDNEVFYPEGFHLTKRGKENGP